MILGYALIFHQLVQLLELGCVLVEVVGVKPSIHLPEKVLGFVLVKV